MITWSRVNRESDTTTPLMHNLFIYLFFISSSKIRALRQYYEVKNLNLFLKEVCDRFKEFDGRKKKQHSKKTNLLLTLL